MENITTWILAVTSILYNQVVCADYSNDFEVFHTSNSGPKTDYVGSHSAFLWKYFDKPAEYRIDSSNDDDKYGKTNDEYRQNPDVERFENVDHYDKSFGDYQYDRISSLHNQDQDSKPNPKNCKFVVKGEMKCTVCKDSKGTHSKSCSVSSTPPKEKYEHTKQRLTAYKTEEDDEKNIHDSEDQPEEY